MDQQTPSSEPTSRNRIDPAADEGKAARPRLDGWQNAIYRDTGRIDAQGRAIFEFVAYEPIGSDGVAAG